VLVQLQPVLHFPPEEDSVVAHQADLPLEAVHGVVVDFVAEVFVEVVAEVLNG
jgi:hypothetical protein